jgi:hypothetical protein
MSNRSDRLKAQLGVKYFAYAHWHRFDTQSLTSPSKGR